VGLFYQQVGLGEAGCKPRGVDALPGFYPPPVPILDSGESLACLPFLFLTLMDLCLLFCVFCLYEPHGI